MTFQDRLRRAHGRRRLAAFVVLTAIVGAAGVVVVQLRDSATPRVATQTAVPPASSPDPVLLNALPGGFEGPAPTAGGWWVDAAPGTRAEVTTRTVHSGRGALRLDTSGTTGTIRVGSRPQPVVAGQEYGASGFAIPTSGSPQLRLEFLDHEGRALDAKVANVGEKDGVWSRTSLRAVAPQSAATARVVVAVGGESAVVWDDLDWWTTALPDAGFETPDEGGSARSWAVSAPEGTSVTRVTGGAHSGSAALELQDSSGSSSALAASALLPAPQGTELEVRGWARSTGGQTTMRVRWFDATRQLLLDAPSNGAPATAPSWTELTLTVTVPDGATYAQLQIATSETGRAASTWDDVSMQPATALPQQSFDISAVATMQGFANTKTSLVSSVNGVPKFSTVTSGAPGVFQLADLRTGTVEYTHEIPGILNGWALTPSLDHRMIFIGGQGHVWRFDTATRTIKDLGQATRRATRVFDLVTAPDGRIWGGSYPGGEVWSIDPATGAFTSAGSVGNGNDYARTLAVDAENVYVGTGSVQPNIVQISTREPHRRTEIAPPREVGKGFLTHLQVHAGFLTALFPNSTRGLYDVAAQRWVSAPQLATTGNLYQRSPGSTAPDNQVYFFRDGKLWGATLGANGVRQRPLATIPAPSNVNGSVVRMRLDGTLADWVVSPDGHTRVVAFKLGTGTRLSDAALPVANPRTLTIALRPEALRVKSLSSRGDEVFVGGYGGASLSLLDTRTLDSTKPPRLVRLVGGASTPKYFGEVEGMITNGRYEFFGTYPKGRIFRLDTTVPWKDRSNPRLVVDLGLQTDQDRPIAWATSGSRTFFGTIPDYGIRGGVLGWFDGAATTPVVV
ncbi:MAG: hypothetical protein ABJA33_11480, partial [Pedococcus sp.]